MQILCRARTHTIALSWSFLCLSGCSPVLADQAVDNLPVRDPGGHIDRLIGLVRRCGCRLFVRTGQEACRYPWRSPAQSVSSADIEVRDPLDGGSMV